MNTLNIIRSVKSKMKIEFLAQVLGMLLLAFLPTYFGFTKQLALVYYFFYTIMLIFAIYYLCKFYSFYKKAENINSENIQDANWFYHELRVELAHYKSFHYITTFIASGFGIVYCYFNKITLISLINKIEILIPSQINLIIMSLTTVFILFVLAESAVSWSFRKELKDLKSILGL